MALTAQEGDVAIRTDLNKSYIHNGGTSGTMADWSELLTPTNAVLSVFGRTGAVVAATNDYTWAQINKAISSLADIATRSHTLLTDIGTNTHAQIDTQLPTSDQKNALAGTTGTPSATNKYVTDYDLRLSDARTPIAHRATHISGGSDALLSTDVIEAIVKRLQESGGPTTLLMGTVGDGQFLKRSGTNILGALATDGFGSVKIGQFSRDSSLANGTQAITGVGFTPRLLICWSGLNNTVGGMSIGFSSGNGTDQDVADLHNAQANSWELTGAGVVRCIQGSGITYTGTLSSFDADGFTISWAKIGAPTGTITVNYLALR